MNSGLGQTRGAAQQRHYDASGPDSMKHRTHFALSRRIHRAAALRVNLVRWPDRLIKGVAWVVLVSYISIAGVQPVVAAVQGSRVAEHQKQLMAGISTPVERYADALDGLKELLSGAVAHPQDAALQATVVPRTDALLGILDSERKSLDAWWQDQESKLLALPTASAVLARQRQLHDAWQQKDQRLRVLVDAARVARSSGRLHALEALLGFLNQERATERGIHVDHRNLPWQAPLAAARVPLEDADQLRAVLQPSGAKANGAKGAGGSAKGAPTPDDLAETIDAPFTADIRAKALALNGDPVKVFAWVHDNIAYFPSSGSVQGAQETLEKQNGNAFDQASLLIALLRSSGIPARYVYGTIEVPVDKALNWVGGAETVAAAQQILGQGGIPNTALVSGGVATTIRVEHVWVEAYVKYSPGRGAVAGTGDAWVPLDPSYKQHDFTQGPNLSQDVTLDSQAFFNAANEGAVTNADEGWVQNVNQANVLQRMREYQTRVASHIAANRPDATVADVVGGSTIRALHLPFLPASAPYTIKTTAARFSQLPDTLRHHFRYRVYVDPADVGYGSPVMDWNIPTPLVAGKNITMAWVAASQSDFDAITSSFPHPHQDGSPIRAEELPTGLPSSIRVKLQLRVDGQTVIEGGTYAIGTELVGAGAFTTYANLAHYDESQDNLVAGQQSALGVSIQGISEKQLARLKSRLGDTQSKLVAGQSMDGINGNSVTGDVLTSNIVTFFADLQSHGRIASAQAGIIDRPGLSYGLFHAVAQPSKLYGVITTRVGFKGVNMDVSHLRNLRWVKNDTDQVAARRHWVAYNEAMGQQASALENSVPEQMFVDKAACRYMNAEGQVVNPALPDCQQGISAMKALVVAAQQGQKIFTITSANSDRAIPLLQQSSSVIDEIRNAVAAGKTVTVHQSPINLFGWQGAGYTEIDPSTGAGAYLIEGKGNGGFLALFDKIKEFMMHMLQLAGDYPIATAVLAIFLALFGPIGALLGLIVAIIAIANDLLTALNNSNGTCTTAISLLLGGLMLLIFLAGFALEFFTLGIGTVIILAIGGLLLSALEAEVPTICGENP
jgi:hypothetical protein